MEIKIETDRVQDAVTQFNDAHEQFISEQKQFAATFESFGNQKTDFINKFQEVIQRINDKSEVDANKKVKTMIEKGQTYVSKSTELDVKLGASIKGGN